MIDRRPETLLRAIDFVRRHRVPFWDALIAASMLDHEVRVLLTENEADFRRIPGIVVVNPFRE